MTSSRTIIARALVGAAATLLAVAASTAMRVPEIPLALRGCWVLEEPPSDEYPMGLSGRLLITGDKLIREARRVGRREGSLELVEHVSPETFEGRITAFEEGSLVTLATALQLKVESGELLLREGDAGSYVFRPCGRASGSQVR